MVVNVYRVGATMGAAGFTVAFAVLSMVLLVLIAWLWPVRDDVLHEMHP